MDVLLPLGTDHHPYHTQPDRSRTSDRTTPYSPSSLWTSFGTVRKSKSGLSLLPPVSSTTRHSFEYSTGSLFDGLEPSDNLHGPQPLLKLLPLDVDRTCRTHQVSDLENRGRRSSETNSTTLRVHYYRVYYTLSGLISEGRERRPTTPELLH